MCVAAIGGKPYYVVSVKRHRGEPGHTRDARSHTGAHKGTQITSGRMYGRRVEEEDASPTSQPSKPTNTQPARQRDDLETAADSTAAGPEPTAPPRGRLRRGRPQSEPDPASTRSQGASPRLLEGGRRNEVARGRHVAAGGAARAPDELETSVLGTLSRYMFEVDRLKKL
jgi:hypothetical protein